MTRPRAPTLHASRLRRYDQALAPAHGVTHVQGTLARWGLDGDADQAADALLIAGELLANARQHGGGARQVELSWRGARLRISVSDRSRRPPRLLGPRQPARPGGHGLYLVERLASRWGTIAQAGGKTVWAEFDLPPATAATSPTLPAWLSPRPLGDGEGADQDGGKPGRRRYEVRASPAAGAHGRGRPQPVRVRSRRLPGPKQAGM